MCWRVICWHYAWCKLYLKLLESNIYMHMCTWMCFKSTIILIAIETLTLGHPKLFIWKKSSSNRRDSMRPKQTCPPSFKGLFDPQKAPRPFDMFYHANTHQCTSFGNFWFLNCISTESLCFDHSMLCHQKAPSNHNSTIWLFLNLIQVGYHVLNLNINWLDPSGPIEFRQPHVLHVWTSIWPSKHCSPGLASAVFTDACRTDQWVRSRGWTRSWVKALIGAW